MGQHSKETEFYTSLLNSTHKLMSLYLVFIVNNVLL